ncbi:MAG: hypothetical protein AB2693_32105 [Candidatus Thiodiazotropha sp.]
MRQGGRFAKKKQVFKSSQMKGVHRFKPSAEEDIHSHSFLREHSYCRPPGEILIDETAIDASVEVNPEEDGEK